MGERRLARECALQLLFLIDISGENIETGIIDLWKLKDPPAHPIQEFCERLGRGFCNNREKIDGIISENADNWRLDRMSIVDRNIMRIAIYEFLFEDDIPEKVSINEAIEIAKRYGGPESTQFINGILDAVKNKLSTYKS
jgi:N utilization substance protein B